MIDWTSDRVAAILETRVPPARRFCGVGTDTRTMTEGDLFVALVGDRVDGHAFLAAAAARGARGVVVRAGTAVPEGLVAFEVEDTLAALGQLARARRREIGGPVIAVTGTNGKTATKEMLGRVVGCRWRVHATRGNLNNLVGVPLTILGAPATAEALIVEAGASIPGEIARLRTIIEPTVGVITNVSSGHLEGFGSVDGVMAEKLSLLDGVPLAVVGGAPPDLGERARTTARHVLVAGTAEHADVRPDEWELDADGRASLAVGGVRARLPLVGRHQVENATIALAIAGALDVPMTAAAAALEGTTLPPGRCEVLRRGGLTVLHDAYNANPGSITASLATAQAMSDDRPLVVVLGSMLELGPDGPALHAEMARRVMQAAPALVGVTGLFVEAFAPWADTLGDRLITADDAATLGERLGPRLRGNEFVLLKASRGVRLERAIPFLLPE